MSSTAHNRWAACRLGDVLMLVNGRAYKQPEMLSVGTPILRIQNLNGGANWYYSDLNLPVDKYCNAGDLLYAWSATFGPYKYNGPRAIFHYHIWNVHPSDAIDKQFAFYELMHITDDIKRSAHGVAMPHVTKSGMEDWPLRLPPLPEQKRIADKLDTVLARVDACRGRLDRIPTLLKRFRQSILAAATSGRLTEDWRQSGTQGSAQEELTDWLAQRAQHEKKPPVGPDLTHWSLVVPQGWVICSVHQFAECLDRLRVPIKRELRKNSSGHYPYYGANGEVGRIDEYIFDDELVLVTEDETFYGREKPIAYRSSGKCWVNNHAHVLRAPSKAASDYLCFALMYYDVIPWLSGTTGRAKLTQQALNALPIASPPKIELEEIVRRVEILFAFADRLEARLATARKQVGQLTPALLAKAFRGELVPQDPNDEPAVELLKRLAAQRETAPKAKRGRKTKVA